MLPLVHLTGTPYEQGRQHGDALRSQIAHNLRLYFNCFEHEGKLGRAEVLRRAQRYGEAIATQNRDYYYAMVGVAVGAGRTLPEIVALNIRYEILYYQNLENHRNQVNQPDGCTAFAVAPQISANGHLLIGDNWDWLSRVLGAVLHTTEPNGLQTLAFTEAGVVGGKIGLNTAGLGLAINGITSIHDDWKRLEKPFHVRCYEILRQQSFEDAIAVITQSNRACSANFLIAQTPLSVMDIEAAPDTVYCLGLTNGVLVHSNHFVDLDGALYDPQTEDHYSSYHRYTRMKELLGSQQPISLADIQKYLRDHTNHPEAICYHGQPTLPPEEPYSTVSSIIMDLNEQVMYLTDGLPCENEYQTYRLGR